MFLDQMWKFLGENEAVIGSITAIIIAIATVITAYAAFRTSRAALPGLKSWHHAMKGRADIATAQELRSSLNKIGERVKNCRFTYEIAGEEVLTTAKISMHARWDNINEALQEFKSKSSEVDILWSSNIDAQTKKLDEFLQDKLKHTIEETYKGIIPNVSRSSDDKQIEENIKRGKGIWRLLFTRFDEETRFSDDFEAIVAGIEKEIDLYLNQHKKTPMLPRLRNRFSNPKK